MKGIAIPQLEPAKSFDVARPSAPTPEARQPSSRWLARQAADFWRNFLFWGARRLPRVARRTRSFFLRGTWKYSPYLRDITLSNARRLLGDDSTDAQREALARAVIGNCYDFVCDVGQSVTLNRRRLLERIESVEGEERYAAARRDGSGAIVVTAHMGSFEVGMAALRQREKRVHVLFRPDSMGLFEKSRSALRRRLGVCEACVDDGLPVWLRLREALAKNEVVLVQGDRVLPGQKGQPMPFLGGRMLMPTGPVKLALASGAPIIPVFSVRTAAGKIRLFIEEPIRPAGLGADAAMSRIASIIAHYVRRYPDQWLVLHRPWCDEGPAG